MAIKRIEDGIRSYLNSLGLSQKPAVDREGMKTLRAQIREEADPIAKPQLLAAQPRRTRTVTIRTPQDSDMPDPTPQPRPTPSNPTHLAH